MKVISPAGEFHVNFSTMEVKEGGQVELKMQMGVWQARSFLEKKDIMWIIKTVFSKPSIIWFIIKTIFRKEAK